MLGTALHRTACPSAPPRLTPLILTRPLLRLSPSSTRPFLSACRVCTCRGSTGHWWSASRLFSNQQTTRKGLCHSCTGVCVCASSCFAPKPSLSLLPAHPQPHLGLGSPPQRLLPLPWPCCHPPNQHHTPHPAITLQPYPPRAGRPPQKPQPFLAGCAGCAGAGAGAAAAGFPLTLSFTCLAPLCTCARGGVGVGQGWGGGGEGGSDAGMLHQTPPCRGEGSTRWSVTSVGDLKRKEI